MKGKHVIIGGGTGFIGSALSAVLKDRGDRVTLISRTQGEYRITWAELEHNGLPKCDAVVNLAGKHIFNLKQGWNDDTRRDAVVLSLHGLVNYRFNDQVDHVFDMNPREWLPAGSDDRPQA